NRFKPTTPTLPA
ncbi:molybdopterin dinucleotide binding domain protein, partial [Vibrio parahaemolyticus VPTS-2010_2]